MSHVTVDSAMCQGHARCTILAPEIFDVDDGGKAFVILDPVPEELRPMGEEAILTCPEGAISATDSGPSA
jgi:ferredoxin